MGIYHWVCVYDYCDRGFKIIFTNKDHNDTCLTQGHYRPYLFYRPLGNTRSTAALSALQAVKKNDSVRIIYLNLSW
jgi:hypothetical protein